MEFISLRNKLLNLWLNELQEIVCSRQDTLPPPPSGILKPRKCSASEWTKTSQWRSSICKGRPFQSTQTMTGSECEEQQINSGIALPSRGKPSTSLFSDQVTVQLLPQTQLTSLPTAVVMRPKRDKELSAVKIRDFLIIFEDVIGNSRWRYVKLLFDFQEWKGSVSLHDCST